MSKMRLFTFVLFILHFNLGWCKERYNPLNDFILHEAGVPNTAIYKDKAGPTNPSSSQSLVANANKRDYVASDFPTLKPITRTSPPSIVTPKPGTTSVTSRRDYVAPQHTTLKPGLTTKTPSVQTTKVTNITPAPKRDYVAPNFPTLKPIQQNKETPGKVKDLINFYDSKNNQGSSSPSSKPSYSSIAQGSSANSRPNSKPGSYSSAVNVSPKTSTTGPSVSTPTIGIKSDSNNGFVKPTIKPASPLPSSILANNNINQGTTITNDGELQILSEELLKKDTNNAAKYVKISYQDKTTSQSKDDKAPLPLLNVSPEVWNIPTIQKFVPLLDNYERDTLVNEYVTAQEKNEENAFMDAVLATSVMRQLMIFLKEKGYVTPDPRQQRDFFKQIWFGLYSRGKGKISSSGFEHVFVSELKNGDVSGLHNWIYFSKEEAANRANYLGYLKYEEFGDKGAVMKMHFNQLGADKPVGTIFIGTSPELEMALYTLCYVTRVGQDCNLKLANKDVNIVTHNFRYRSKNYLGSAYPQF